MITLDRADQFTIERLNSKYGKEYVIEGCGYRFHAVISNDNTNWLHVLPTKKYSPPVNCIEYLYYDADCRVGLDYFEEFFKDKNPALADPLRAKFLELTL